MKYMTITEANQNGRLPIEENAFCVIKVGLEGIIIGGKSVVKH